MAWIDAKRDAYMVNTIAFMGIKGALTSRIFRKKMLAYALTHAILHHDKRKIMNVLRISFVMRVPLTLKTYARAILTLMK